MPVTRRRDVSVARTSRGAEPFASIDPTSTTTSRPTGRRAHTDAWTREITWPTLEFAPASASEGRPPGAAHGPGADLRWGGFCDTVIEVAARDRCGTIVTRRAARRHAATRARRVSGSTTEAAAMARLGLEPPRTRDRRASSGCSTDTCPTRASGARPSGHVPHYVATPTEPACDPSAARAVRRVHRRPLDCASSESQPTRGGHGSTARSRATRRWAVRPRARRAARGVVAPMPKLCERGGHPDATTWRRLRGLPPEQGNEGSCGRRTPRRSRARARVESSRLSWSTRSSLPWNIVA